jgi:hypothetical protein
VTFIFMSTIVETWEISKFANAENSEKYIFKPMGSERTLELARTQVYII